VKPLIGSSSPPGMAYDSDTIVFVYCLSIKTIRFFVVVRTTSISIRLRYMFRMINIIYK